MQASDDEQPSDIPQEQGGNCEHDSVAAAAAAADAAGVTGKSVSGAAAQASASAGVAADGVDATQEIGSTPAEHGCVLLPEVHILPHSL